MTPGSGVSPGEGNGNPLQYSWLENSMDRGNWWAVTPWGHKELDMTELLTQVWTELSTFLQVTGPRQLCLPGGEFLGKSHSPERETNLWVGLFPRTNGICFP